MKYSLIFSCIFLCTGTRIFAMEQIQNAQASSSGNALIPVTADSSSIHTEFCLDLTNLYNFDEQHESALPQINTQQESHRQKLERRKTSNRRKLMHSADLSTPTSATTSTQKNTLLNEILQKKNITQEKQFTDSPTPVEDANNLSDIEKMKIAAALGAASAFTLTTATLHHTPDNKSSSIIIGASLTSALGSLGYILYKEEKLREKKALRSKNSPRQHQPSPVQTEQAIPATTTQLKSPNLTSIIEEKTSLYLTPRKSNRIVSPELLALTAGAGVLAIPAIIHAGYNPRPQQHLPTKHIDFSAGDNLMPDIATLPSKFIPVGPILSVGGPILWQILSTGVGFGIFGYIVHKISTMIHAPCELKYERREDRYLKSTERFNTAIKELREKNKEVKDGVEALEKDVENIGKDIANLVQAHQAKDAHNKLFSKNIVTLLKQIEEKIKIQDTIINKLCTIAATEHPHNKETGPLAPKNLTHNHEASIELEKGIQALQQTEEKYEKKEKEIDETIATHIPSLKKQKKGLLAWLGCGKALD